MSWFYSAELQEKMVRHVPGKLAAFCYSKFVFFAWWELLQLLPMELMIRLKCDVLHNNSVISGEWKQTKIQFSDISGWNLSLKPQGDDP